MAANVAPPIGGTATSKAFAANYADTDLTAQSGKPTFAAQRVDFRNNGATVQDAVFTLQDGTSMTVPLAPGATWPHDSAPVASLSASSGADVSAVAYWWHNCSGAPFNA